MITEIVRDLNVVEEVELELELDVVVLDSCVELEMVDELGSELDASVEDVSVDEGGAVEENFDDDSSVEEVEDSADDDAGALLEDAAAEEEEAPDGL